MKIVRGIYKKARTYFYLLCPILFLIVSCEMFEYSPNQSFDENSPIAINKKNINWLLLNGNQDDTIRIVFTGDSQRVYDEAELLKEKVNTMDGIDMMILAGDISDFGVLNEFEWIHEIFSQMKVPYISVIGNHDIISNGDEVYKKMYGDLNFSFVFDSVKFVFHNSNSREYRFNGSVPDMNWLRGEFTEEAGVTHTIPVSHVPPYSTDFDSELISDYTTSIKNAPGILVSLHGHLHNMGDGYPFNDGVRYINSNSVGKRKFILLEISKGKIVKTLVDY
ncbi:MAG: metallophosphoesterase [Bacteroidota bacterium]|nr:metallophosphoesterase [Bacteroidota bacterium]